MGRLREEAAAEDEILRDLDHGLWGPPLRGASDERGFEALSGFGKRAKIRWENAIFHVFLIFQEFSPFFEGRNARIKATRLSMPHCEP